MPEASRQTHGYAALVLALERDERRSSTERWSSSGNGEAVVRVGPLVAGDRVLELAQTAAQRAAHLGQALRAEHEQHDETEQAGFLAFR